MTLKNIKDKLYNLYEKLEDYNCITLDADDFKHEAMNYLYNAVGRLNRMLDIE